MTGPSATVSIDASVDAAVEHLDWASLAAQLDSEGHALLPGWLGEPGAVRANEAGSPLFLEFLSQLEDDEAAGREPVFSRETKNPAYAGFFVNNRNEIMSYFVVREKNRSTYIRR